MIELITKENELFMPITYPEGILVVEYDGLFEFDLPVLSGHYFSFRKSSATQKPIKKGHKMRFKVKRDLESLVKTNKLNCEWLKNKAIEIIEGCQSKREIVDRLVEYLSNEVEYYLIKKREIDRFNGYLSKNPKNDIKEAIKSYFPELKNRLLINLMEMEHDWECSGRPNYERFEKRLDEIETEFYIHLENILADYKPVTEEVVKDFLTYVYKTWDVFECYMDCDLNPKHTLENGGRCAHKSTAFNALCQELDMVGVEIIAYYDGLKNRSHSLNAVKIDNEWEIVDPTQNRTQIKESKYLVKCYIEKSAKQIIKKAYFTPIRK